MVDFEKEEMYEKLEQLRAEHSALDTQINDLSQSFHGDQLRMMRLKRRKLAIKDEMLYIENQLEPDIIA